jgi:hypothetical protein
MTAVDLGRKSFQTLHGRQQRTTIGNFRAPSRSRPSFLKPIRSALYHISLYKDVFKESRKCHPYVSLFMTSKFYGVRINSQAVYRPP